MAKILIVGCGEIGTDLAYRLTNQGHSVIGLKRTPPLAGDQRIQYYTADIGMVETLDNLDTDFEHIFLILSADERTEASYRKVYALGIGNLIAKFSQAASNPCWWMVSSSSVYGQTGGEWVDEQSEANPQTKTGQLIRAAEQTLVNRDKRNVVVRFSGIYGPGRDYLLRMAQQQPAIQKTPAYFTNRIHVQDCVAVLEFLFNRRLAQIPLAQYYLASDDDPAPQWEVMSWLAAQMHIAEPAVKVPGKLIDCNKRCSNHRLKMLGYQFIYPGYKEGYSELLKCYAERIR